MAMRKLGQRFDTKSKTKRFKFGPSTADHFLFSLILQNAFLVKWKDMTHLLTSKRSKLLIYRLQDYCMFPQGYSVFCK